MQELGVIVKPVAPVFRPAESDELPGESQEEIGTASTLPTMSECKFMWCMRAYVLACMWCTVVSMADTIWWWIRSLPSITHLYLYPYLWVVTNS